MSRISILEFIMLRLSGKFMPKNETIFFFIFFSLFALPYCIILLHYFIALLVYIFKEFIVAIKIVVLCKIYCKMLNSNDAYNLLIFLIKKESSFSTLYNLVLNSFHFNQFASQNL